MTNHPAPSPKPSDTTPPPPAAAPPQYSNTRGCLWIVIVGTIAVVGSVALIVLFGDF